MTRLAVDDRRRLLVEAAARVVARDGIAEASTRAITTEAGMTRGTFHYCFRSKDELFEELVRMLVKDMIDAALNVWDDGADLATNLRAGIDAIFRTGIADPDGELFSYELTVYALRRTDTAVARNQYDDYSRQATEYLTFVADRAGIRWTLPMDQLARMVAVMVDGSVLNWLADRNSELAAATLGDFAGMLTGLAVPASRSA
ncbi:TetR/AcrR family transcriptional regulator [Pseudonocardia sp. GCM10023141]|uniref:TetR/AcrR family transcriptional regulator n=1 Tax=Pseudonocardia sp. GCM10023141 TaxID=3252653 RepID=UPI003609909C